MISRTMGRHRDTTSAEQRHQAVSELNQKMKRWKHEADVHKRTALTATLAIIASSALLPVAVVLSHEWSGFWFGNVIPTLLAAISAIAAGWLQFERPYEGWTLFRRYQQNLETDLMLYRFKAGPYRDEETRGRVLIERLAYCEWQMQQEWKEYIPTDGEINGRSRQPAT
jgi:hypothetical protein